MESCFAAASVKVSRWVVGDFTRSAIAAARGIDNSLPMECLANIQRVAACLRGVERLLVVQAVITSGYRCPVLNKAVGGSALSDHLTGRAVDVGFPGIGHLDAARRIAALPGGFWTVELRVDGLHLGLGVPNRLLLLRQAIKGGKVVAVSSFS